MSELASATAEPVAEAAGVPTLLPADWIAALQRHYLESFVRDGGAALKFVVRVAVARETFQQYLGGVGQRQGFLVVALSADTTRVQQMDQLLFAVCAQLPWTELIERRLAGIARTLGYRVPAPGNTPFIERLALANDLDAAFLALPMRRHLQSEVFQETSLARDFRVAMTQLCLTCLDGTAQSVVFADLQAWLTGTLSGITKIKPYQIFSRINRHSARYIFESLTHFVAQCGYPGLLVSIDIDRVLDTKRASDRLNYSKANALDAYEVVRQFIDGLERLRNCLLVITADRRFLLPQGKGIELYQALKYRVYDEVHDRRRANPLGSMVRLAAPGSSTAEVAQHG